MKFLSLSLIFLICIACRAKIVKYDPRIFTLKDGVLYYKEEVFTGQLLRISGNLTKEIQYLDGRKHGSEKHYYQNGKLHKHLFYQKGLADKNQYTYYESGHKQRLALFKRGQHHGETTEWYESGEIKSYTLYREGKVQAHKKWQTNGSLSVNYIYKNGKRIDQ